MRCSISYRKTIPGDNGTARIAGSSKDAVFSVFSTALSLVMVT
jgi:hypothetical protein